MSFTPTSPAKPKWSRQVYSQLLQIAQEPKKSIRMEKIAQLDDNALMCLVEIVFNVLRGKVSMSRQVKKQVGHRRRQLRKLSLLRNVETVRGFLNQVGGSPFLSLLPVLISAVGALANHV